LKASAFLVGKAFNYVFSVHVFDTKASTFLT